MDDSGGGAGAWENWEGPLACLDWHCSDDVVVTLFETPRTSHAGYSAERHERLSISQFRIDLFLHALGEFPFLQPRRSWVLPALDPASWGDFRADGR